MDKNCSTCDHFPNDEHCVGCLWSEKIQGNTRWEKKNDPDVIERKVIDDIKAEIRQTLDADWSDGLYRSLQIIELLIVFS